MMQARAFNTISINSKTGTLTKSSINVEKLRNEINYYRNLPTDISILFPTLINYQDNFSQYEIEYLPYQNISELIVSGDLSCLDGRKILLELLKILDKLHEKKFDNKLSAQDISSFYIEKTFERIEKLQSIPFFKKLFAEPFIIINKKKYLNFNALKKQFINFSQNLASSPSTSVIHGDFCFSNILYCPQKNIVKLIDPRGSFTEPGIFGHSLYDYSKLMHCLHGRYDFIVNDQFTLIEESSNRFIYSIPSSTIIDFLHTLYCKELAKRSINLEFIYFIEASLFLSMASLHYENFQRQKIFYFTGIVLLHNVLERNNAYLY